MKKDILILSCLAVIFCATAPALASDHDYVSIASGTIAVFDHPPYQTPNHWYCLCQNSTAYLGCGFCSYNCFGADSEWNLETAFGSWGNGDFRFAYGITINYTCEEILDPENPNAYLNFTRASSTAWTTDQYHERDCPSFTNIYDCFNDENGMYAYCVWNYASSTCGYPGGAESGCGVQNDLTLCLTEAECLAVPPVGYWQTEWKSDILTPATWWHPVCHWYNTMTNQVATSSEDVSTSSDANISYTFWSIVNHPKTWILGLIYNLNPLNHAPFSWILQGTAIINNEIDNHTYATSSAAFSSSTVLCLAMPDNSGNYSASNTPECVQMLPVDELSQYNSFFIPMRNLQIGLLGLAFFFYIFKVGGSWMRKHSLKQ